MKTKDCYT